MILYGLLINYKQKACKVYKLHLDFINQSSFLEQGKETIPLSDAVNNLLFNFDSKNRMCYVQQESARPTI